MPPAPLLPNRLLKYLEPPPRLLEIDRPAYRTMLDAVCITGHHLFVVLNESATNCRTAIEMMTNKTHNRIALFLHAIHSSVRAQVQEAIHDPRDFVRKGFSLAPVTRNEELLRSPADERSTRLVEIDIARDMWLR